MHQDQGIKMIIDAELNNYQAPKLHVRLQERMKVACSELLLNLRIKS